MLRTFCCMIKLRVAWLLAWWWWAEGNLGLCHGLCPSLFPALDDMWGDWCGAANTFLLLVLLCSAKVFVAILISRRESNQLVIVLLAVLVVCSCVLIPQQTSRDLIVTRHKIITLKTKSSWNFVCCFYAHLLWRIFIKGLDCWGWRYNPLLTWIARPRELNSRPSERLKMSCLLLFV